MAFMKFFRRITSSLAMVSGLTAISLCAISVQAQSSQHASQRVLQKDIRDLVAQGQAKQIGVPGISQHMQLAIQLPLHNQSDLTAFLRRLSNSSSPDFRKYLSVEEFTRQYGPTEGEYQKVVDFAKSNGFTVTDTHKNRLVLDIGGTVEQVQNAFHVTMKTYQHPFENRSFFSADRAPSIAADLPIAHIGGLDNYATGHSGARQGSMGGKGAPGDTSAYSGSGPGGTFLGSDIRAAYYGGTNLTGAGQCVALLEAGGYQMSDVTASFDGVPYTVPINNVYVDGADNTVDSNTGDAEEVMDIVAAIGMAPGLDQVRVYEMPNDESFGYADVDALSKIASENVCKQISSSFTWNAGAADVESDNAIFQEFAAQGQTYFNVSMDSGAYSNYFWNYPQENPWVIAVGATDLTTTGPGGNWKAETAWNYSGGGPNNDGVPIPAWQVPVINATATPGTTSTTANNGSITLRNVPDVAMEGNTDNFLCVNGGSCGGWGGTSIATPRWAAFTALVNQQAAQSNLSPVGFIAPLIYKIGQSSAYNTDFHDIVSGNNGCCEQTLFYYALPGYDLITGWGSPNGQAMINALVGADQPGFVLMALPSSVVVNATGNSTTISVMDQFGFTGPVTLGVVSGTLPNGVTASFSPNPTTGGTGTTSVAGTTSTLTLSAPSGTDLSSLPANLTITGASGTLSASTTVQLATQATCTQASINPWVQVNGAAWQNLTSVTVYPGATVNLGPQAGSGTWSWNGPDNFTATTAEIDNIALGDAPDSKTDNQYTVTYTAPSGCQSTQTYDITVDATPNFSTSDESAALVLAQGGSNSSTVDISSVNNFNAATTLSVSGLPTGVTASFAPSSVTPAAGGIGQATLTLTATSAATLGNATITITGTSGTLTNSTTVPLYVTNAANASTCTPLQPLPYIQINSGAWLQESTATVGTGASVNLDFDTQEYGGTYVWSGPNSYSSTSTSTNSITIPSLGTGANTYVATYIDTNNCATSQTFVITQVSTPTFTSQAMPTMLELQAGGTALVGVNIISLNGFDSDTELNVSGLPNGVQGTFSPTSITPAANGGTTAILTLTAESGAAIGPATLTINATSGSGSSSSTVALTVNANACISNATLVPWMESATNQVWENVQSMTLSASDQLNLNPQPNAGVWLWSSSTGFTTVMSGSSFITDLTLNPGQNTFTATYTDSNGCQTTLPFTATSTSAVTFALTDAPTSLTLPQSGTASTTVTLDSVNGFDSATTFSISGLPTGISTSFSPVSVTPAADGSSTSTLTLTASATVMPGNYTATISGTSGSTVNTTTLPVVVPAFSMTASPTTLTATAGSASTSTDTITVNGQPGFTSSVALSVSGLPTGVTSSLSKSSVTPGSSGSATSMLNLSVASTTAVGAYPLTITGMSTSPAQTFSANAFLVVSPANCTTSTITPYILSSSTNSWTNAYTLTVPYGSTVDLGPQPSQGTWNWSGPNGFNVTQSSAQISDIPLSVGTNTYLATYVNSSGCASTGTFVIMESAPAPDFTIAAAPAPVTIASGGDTGTATITLGSLNGFDSTVTLSVDASQLPTGASASLASTSVTPAANGTTTTTLTFTTSASTPAGTFMIPVSATSGPLSHSATAALTVSQPVVVTPPVTTATATFTGSCSGGTMQGATTAFSTGAGTLTAVLSSVPAGTSWNFWLSDQTNNTTVTEQSGASPLTITESVTAASYYFYVQLTSTPCSDGDTWSITVTYPPADNVDNCGSDNGGSFASLSSTDPNLCSTGSTAGALTNANGQWSWSCANSSTGTTTTGCTASVQALTAPTVTSMAFTPNSVAVGGTSMLAVTLSNANTDPVQLTSNVTIIGLPGSSLSAASASTIACSDGSGANDPPIVIPAQSGSRPGTCTLTFANVSAETTANTYTATWPSGVTFADANNSVNTVSTTASSTATLTVTTAPINGACGTDSGGKFTSLSSSDPNLCSEGTVSAFTSSTSGWTWSCNGSNRGTNATTCSAGVQPLTATTTTLIATPAAQTAAQSVTFTASVDPSGTSAPTGTVTISGGGQSCVATLAAISTKLSKGACALTFANAGSYTVTATYSGDSTFAASGTSMNLQVTSATLTAQPIPAPALSDRMLLLLGLLYAGIGVCMVWRGARV
jgi:uncharacterized membrane protein